MCGPIRLMDAVRRAWTERELEPTNLRYETFGNSGWYEAEPFTVRIPRLGGRDNCRFRRVRAGGPRT